MSEILTQHSCGEPGLRSELTCGERQLFQGPTGSGQRKGRWPRFCSPHPEHTRERTSRSKSGKIGFGCQEVKFHAQSQSPDRSLWFTHFVPPSSHGFDFLFPRKPLHSPFSLNVPQILCVCVWGGVHCHLWGFCGLAGTGLGTLVMEGAHTNMERRLEGDA